MARLLVVHHSPTDRLRALAAAVVAGARHEDLSDVEVVERFALDATVEDVLSSDGYVLGSTANFGYISGALKHFFDTTYEQTRSASAGRPFSYWIHGGHDTTGAERAMRAITTGYGWRLQAQPLVFIGEVDGAHLEAASDLGGTVAAALLDD